LVPPTFDFRHRTDAGPRLAGLRMLLILVGFFISFGTNICIKPNFAGKDLHQMVSAHFSKVSIESVPVSPDGFLPKKADLMQRAFVFFLV